METEIIDLNDLCTCEIEIGVKKENWLIRFLKRIFRREK